MTRLSENFTLRELVASDTARSQGIENRPEEQAVIYLARLAMVLEMIRAELGGRPVVVTSGYRSPVLNRAVGGSRTSAHLDGRAVDLVVPLFGPPAEVAARVAGMGFVVFDQLILERFGRREWVHLGMARIGEVPRRQVLTIVDGKVTPGLAAS